MTAKTAAEALTQTPATGREGEGGRREREGEGGRQGDREGGEEREREGGRGRGREKRVGCDCIGQLFTGIIA